jgi:ABC-2 type transport system ATP-binding protein
MKGKIKVKDLVKIYKSFNFEFLKIKSQNIVALNNVNFEINTGEIVAYIGPNGAGKTTTIKILSGILYPTSGYVLVNGINPFLKKNRKIHKKNIGVMLGHHSKLIRDLPVIDSFLLLGKIYELSKNEINDRIEKLASMLQVEDILKRKVRTLSLGQRIRCELLATFLHSPPILFLDEPTIGVDISTRYRLYEFIKKINKEEKITVIITSHDIHDIEMLAERIILIDNGKILFDGKKEEFIKKFSLNKKKVFIEMKNLFPEELINIFFDKKIKFQKIEDYKIVLEMEPSDSILEILKEVEKYGFIKDIHIEKETLREIIKNIYENKK